MAVSQAQLNRATVICKCGCGEKFSAFPVYKDGGGGLRIPEYKRGHHPRCRKKQFGRKGFKPWNLGLRASAGDARVSTLGKRGAEHWNFDPEQNPDWFAKDFDFRAFSAKFGRKLRSKGNKAYAKFRLAILKRDGFKCAECGLQSSDYSETCVLNVHHLVPVKTDWTRIFDPSNVVTLCVLCHAKHHRARK